MTDARVVLITAPDAETAHSLASRLVEARLAACVNVLPGVISHYRWEGKLHKDGEVLLIAKTTEKAVARLIAEIKERHPAKVPEIIALPIQEGQRDYLSWLAESVA